MDPKIRIQQIVEQSLETWISLLNITWLTITPKWSESYSEDEADNQASTLCNWQYREASIIFYLPVLASMTDDKIETVVVHELVHCILNPMESHVKSKYTEQCEFAVESISQSLLNIRDTLLTPTTKSKS